MMKLVRNGLFRTRETVPPSKPDDPLSAYLNSDLVYTPGSPISPSSCSICDNPLIGLKSAFSDGGCGHVFHKACACKLSQCPVCFEPFSPVKRTSRKEQRKSALRIKTIDTDDTSTLAPRVLPSFPKLLDLDVDIRSSCRTLGPGAGDTHIMLQLQPYFPEAEPVLARNPLKVAILLDLQPLMLANKRYSEPKAVCASVMSFLIPGDTWMLLTTTKSSSKRLIKGPSVVGSSTQKELEELLGSLTFDEAFYELDLVKTVQHATRLFADTDTDKSCVVFVSDGSSMPDKLQSKHMARCFRGSQTVFLCLGVGLCHNATAMRTWGSSCEEGLYLDALQMDDIQRVFGDVRAGSLLMPLTNIKVDLQLHEGATIISLTDKDVVVHEQSSDRLLMTIDRLSPYELRQIMIEVRIPPVDRAFSSSPQRPTLARQDSALRLAELELMIQMLPTRLASCQVSYNHPCLSDGIRLTHEELGLTIKRAAQTEVDVTILACSVKKDALQLLRQALVLESQQQKEAALGLLRDAEQTVHALCTEHALSTADFETLLAEFSMIRFRLSPRYHVAAVRRRLSTTQVVQVTPDLTQMQSWTASEIESGSMQTPINKRRSHLWEQCVQASPIEIRSAVSPSKSMTALVNPSYSQQLLGKSPKALPSTKQASLSKVATPLIIRPSPRIPPPQVQQSFDASSRRASFEGVSRPALSIMTDSKSYRATRNYDELGMSPLQRLEKQIQASRGHPESLARLPSSTDIQKLIRRSSQAYEKPQRNKDLPAPPLMPSPIARVRSYVLDQAQTRSLSRFNDQRQQQHHSDPARNIWRMQQAERGEELSLSEADLSRRQMDMSAQSQETSRTDLPFSSDAFRDESETPVSDYFGLRRGHDGRPRAANLPRPEDDLVYDGLPRPERQTPSPTKAWPLTSSNTSPTKSNKTARIESTHYSATEPVSAPIVEETECATSRPVSRGNDDGEEIFTPIEEARESGESIELVFGGQLKWSN